MGISNLQFRSQSLYGISAICFVMSFLVGRSGRIAHTPNGRNMIELTITHASLEDIAAALSKQSGAIVQASESIRDRRVTLVCSGLSLERTINLICELTELQWEQKSTGEIVISRKAVRRPRNLSEVPSALQSTLPRDLRTYLGLDGWTKMEPADKWKAAGNGQRGKELEDTRSRLVNELRRRLSSDMEVSYASLPEQWRSMVNYLIFYQRFGDLEAVLYDRESPHMIDPRRSTISIGKNGILMVQMFITPTYPIGFGTSIQ